MQKLVLVRHGESGWNKENKFTGWTDVDLTEKGVREAKQAGATLKKEGYTFDMVFTSVLKRAIKTLCIMRDKERTCWTAGEDFVDKWFYSQQSFKETNSEICIDNSHETVEETVKIHFEQFLLG